MYHRNILEELVKWWHPNNRKPLIVRSERPYYLTGQIEKYLAWFGAQYSE
jgi:hypothetical protein